MTPRLVTFDLDDTLWDVAPVMRGAEATLRDWLASQAPRLGPLPIEQLWAIRGQLLEAEPLLRFRLSELRRRILLQALRSAGYPTRKQPASLKVHSRRFSPRATGSASSMTCTAPWSSWPVTTPWA